MNHASMCATLCQEMDLTFPLTHKVILLFQSNHTCCTNFHLSSIVIPTTQHKHSGNPVCRFVRHSFVFCDVQVGLSGQGDLPRIQHDTKQISQLSQWTCKFVVLCERDQKSQDVEGKRIDILWLWTKTTQKQKRIGKQIWWLSRACLTTATFWFELAPSWKCTRELGTKNRRKTLREDGARTHKLRALPPPPYQRVSEWKSCAMFSCFCTLACRNETPILKSTHDDALTTFAQTRNTPHVVANKVSSPLAYCITSLPPSFDSPYNLSTNVIGTYKETYSTTHSLANIQNISGPNNDRCWCETHLTNAESQPVCPN